MGGTPHPHPTPQHYLTKKNSKKNSPAARFWIGWCYRYQEKVWNEHIQPGVAHARTCPADLEIDCISLNVFTQSLSKAQDYSLCRIICSGFASLCRIAGSGGEVIMAEPNGGFSFLCGNELSKSIVKRSAKIQTTGRSIVNEAISLRFENYTEQKQNEEKHNTSV